MSIFQNIPKETRQRLAYASLTIIAAIFVGGIGFRFFERITWIDAFYMSAQTVTTVGYGDVPTLSPGGRLFATVFMVIGAGTVLFALTTLMQALIQTEIIEALTYRRKAKEMEKLKNHYIVCGAGRVGRRIIRNLLKENLPFVIIESDERKIAEFAELELPILLADATLEDTLIRAGVERAKGLAACLPDDAANVYVVLTARGRNEKMHIVARAVEEQAEAKLIRAGANRVVAPTIIGSQSMARALLKPAIADFMDSIVAETLDLAFEEIAITSHSGLVGKRLRETNLSRELSLIVIAIRRKDGELHFHPVGESRIEDGDLLIVVGKAESMRNLVQSNR